MARHAKKSSSGRASRRRKPEKSDNTSEDETSDTEALKPSKKQRSSTRKTDNEEFETPLEEVVSESDEEPSPSKRVRRTNANVEKEDDYESNKRKTSKQRFLKKSKSKSKSTMKLEEDDYEVDAIVGDRVIKGHVQYKVRWKGYGSDDDTWEGEDNLNCPDLIEEYNDTKSEEETRASKKRSSTGRRGRSGVDDGPSEKKKGKSSKRRDQQRSKSLKNDASKEKSTSEGNLGPEADGEYKVLRIIDMHTLRNGKREFLVRWLGWSEKDDTWEPEENLLGNEKLDKFLEKLDAIKQFDMKELRVNRTTTDHFSVQSKALAVEGRVRESKRFLNKTRQNEAILLEKMGNFRLLDKKMTVVIRKTCHSHHE